MEELERRITHALERISRAAGKTGAGAAGDAGDAGALKQSLEEERTANEQLRERLRSLNDRQHDALAALEEQVGNLRMQVARRENDLARLKNVNARLRGSNAKLREANAAGLADAGLVNASMAVELEALRSVQSADRAELEAVLEELRPIIEESA